MSILPMLVFVGVAGSTRLVAHDNDAGFQPITTTSQEHRICAELCLSGLGGEPCGKSCQDITPSGLPVQSIKSDSISNSSRREACSVLCPNHLGYPLCNCYSSENIPTSFKPDFVEICGFFCVKYKYRIYGCQSCSVYEEIENQVGNTGTSFMGRSIQTNKKEIDWEKWCKEQCSVGNGGAACNCDILPFAHLTAK